LPYCVSSRIIEAQHNTGILDGIEPKPKSRYRQTIHRGNDGTD